MSVKNCWWYLASFRKPSEVETMRKAEMQLGDTIEELKEKETVLKNELTGIAANVKRAQAAKATSKVKQLVMSSAAKRNTLTITCRKRMALEQQLDAIATTQLNQQVLSSMKQTSHALKSLGLDSTLNTVDEVMADMQDATSDISEITQTLSTSLNVEPLDDDALAAELALLMGDEADGVVEPPKVVNTITTNPSAKAEPTLSPIAETTSSRQTENEPQPQAQEVELQVSA